MDGEGSNGPNKQPKKPLPLIKYKPVPGGPAYHWSPASKVKKCGCFSDYAYPNKVVFALDSERRSLVNQVRRISADADELKKTAKVQHDRIAELEEVARRHSSMVGFVRDRTESILADCEMLMEEVVGVQLDGQMVGSSSVGQPSGTPRSNSPKVGDFDLESDPSEDPNHKD